jgi:hypothetical protein
VERTTTNVLNRNVIRPNDPFSSGRGKRAKTKAKLDQLEKIAIGCEVWTANFVTQLLDKTNDRIYNEMLATPTFSGSYSY